MTAGKPEDRAAPHKKIVIFADGTGNSFASQESNVWRLYRALDKTDKPEALLQVARYIPGVGTSGNAVLRAIDGATGFGVPSNIRKLYRFLCWNWSPGDEIYLFGFSRGAFTVRSLAAMVAMQGLMPREIGGVRVTGPEMNRNVAAAWLAYRAETAPLVETGRSPFNPLNWKMNPLISVVRGLRDGLTWARRSLLGQKTHREVLAQQPDERKPGAVKVRFMGLFDTVEAYGAPVEELRWLWSRLVWPITFRNRRPSWVVGKLRHALSLDEERKTFRPIRIDVSARPDGKPVPETQELWFAGVHSDVGGGYPDDETAYEPLLWIAGEATRQELIFDQAELANYRSHRNPQALIHDSRKGLGSLYRYGPRRIGSGAEYGGPPVVHHSVISKMERGHSGYVPLRLPQAFRIYPGRGRGWAGIEPADHRRDEARAARMDMLIRRRVLAYWVKLGLLAALAAIPVLDWWHGTEAAAVPILSPLLGAVLPGWVVAWVEALLSHWPLSVATVVLLWVLRQRDAALVYLIKDVAGRLWTRPD